MNSHWMRSLSAWQTRYLSWKRRPRLRAPRTYRPWAEPLEDRWLLSTWTPLDSGTFAFLKGIWANSPTDVFVTGGSGTIRHSNNGTTWTAQTSGSSDNLDGIWGSSAADIVVTDSSGAILHSNNDGATWSPQTTGSSDFLVSVWGSSATDIFAVGLDGSTILHSGNGGTTWTPQASGNSYWFQSVWGSSSTDVFAVGYNGTILHSGNGGAIWTTQASGTLNELFGVWADSPTDVFVVGYNGTILHSSDDGTTWTPQTSGTANALLGVWGNSPTDVFTVGENGTILHSGNDGTTWTPQTSGILGDLYGVGGSTTRVYVVGWGGALLSKSRDSLVFTTEPGSAPAGMTLSTTVTVEDGTGHPDTNFTGSVTVAIASGSGSFTSGSTTTVPVVNGVAAFANLQINTVDTYTLSATATGEVTGADSTRFAITPAVAAMLRVGGFPSPIAAGDVQLFTVTAQDIYGNTATSYRGTVHFTSNDRLALFSHDYAFTAADNGRHTFGAVFRTTGTQTIMATDVADGSITGTQAGIVVTPAAAVVFVVTAPATVSPEQPFDITVTALDPYGNTDTDYQGTVTFSTTDPDPSVVLPADYTFTADDAGAYTFPGETTLITPGDQILTVTDTADGAITGSATITVTSGNAPQPRWALVNPPPLRTALGGTCKLPPSGRWEPTHPEVVTADWVFGSLYQDGPAEFSPSRGTHVSRSDVEQWLPDIFDGDDSRWV